MNPVTLEEMIADADAHDREPALADLATNTDIPTFQRSDPRIVALTISCWWLNRRLRAAGVAEKDVRDVAFAHGQLSFQLDPYKMAVRLYNLACKGEYVRGGRVLADSINHEFMSRLRNMTDVQTVSLEVGMAIERAARFEKLPDPGEAPDGTRAPEFDAWRAEADGWTLTVFHRGGVWDGVAMKDATICRFTPRQTEYARAKIELDQHSQPATPDEE